MSEIIVRIAYRERGGPVSIPAVLDCIGFTLGISSLADSDVDPSQIEITGLKSTGSLDSTTHVSFPEVHNDGVSPSTMIGRPVVHGRGELHINRTHKDPNRPFAESLPDGPPPKGTA